MERKIHPNSVFNIALIPIKRKKKKDDILPWNGKQFTTIHVVACKDHLLSFAKLYKVFK